MTATSLHEAICKAAGWEPYCDRCGKPTIRHGRMSICSDPECRPPELPDERSVYFDEEGR